MAQLKDTIIQGTLEIQGKDSEGKALILPEGSKIYIGNEPFKGGGSDWNENTETSDAFIKNKPPIYKGTGEGSVISGISNEATAEAAHAEGFRTHATGLYSHTEGEATRASGSYSHAEGYNTIASGGISHAEGFETIASGDDSHVQGRYNIEDKDHKYAHIIGNGILGIGRSNAHTVDWDGNGWYAGKLTQEGTPTEEKDLATKKYVDDKKLSEFKNDSNYERCKYFNFIEAGVDVEGNPTYDEIKEAVLSDVTPVLIHGHYIAYMTSGQWDAEGFEQEELPGFTFVTHRSDMNNHWKIKYTEFWCTKQDDGSTLWVVSEHYYIEDFVAKYGVTTFSEIQDAYNDEKIMFCTHGGLVTKLDILAPNSYAQFSGLDDMGNPALLKVTKDNVWTRTNVTNATTDYVNSEINDLNKTHIVPLTSKIDSFGQYITGKYPMLSALSSMNAVDILKSVYSFRGGFCDNAGTLHIKNPGIYLIMQGGTGNKTITINYPTGKEFEATNWSGIILLAYESGVVTPIGIKSSLAFIDAFQMPGTFQGWTSDGRYSTTINYPSMCVVAYLGNSNVDYLA